MITLEQMIQNTKNVKKFIPVSCGIICRVFDGIPHILLIQRSDEDKFPLYFEAPRGKCDNGQNEPLIDCLKREVKEETNLDVKPIKYINKFSYVADNGERKSTQYNYLCKCIYPDQEIILSHEHIDYKWVKSLGEIELMVLPEIKRALYEVFSASQKLVNYNVDDNEQNIEE